MKIRLVTTTDAQQILDIYAPFILHTTTSFETEVPSLFDFEKRILDYSKTSPWLVAEHDGKILGYAYATAHRGRKAYQWNQETTVYVHPDYRKRGIAKKLYDKLFELLVALGYGKALAIITLPNDASIAIHKSFGFKHIGDMKNIGYKFDQWHTTSWWDKDLQPHNFIPQEIKSMKSIQHLIR